MRKDERAAARILVAIAAVEGAWCLANLMVGGPRRLLDYLGFVQGGAGAPAWVAAFAVAGVYTWYAAHLPSVRANLVRPSVLKALGLAVAVAAGVCEEAIFRRLLMNSLAHAGYVVAAQVGISGLAFGAAHGIWGVIRRSAAAAIGATVATGILGALLAGVFVLGHRVLAPCVVAHFLINAFAEPGLVLAAVRGEFGARASARAAAAADRP